MHPEPDPRLIEFAGAVLDDEVRDRVRIARYLHDTLLQTLVVLSFSAAVRDSAKREDAGPDGKTPSVAELVGECCRHARIVSSLLSLPFIADGDVAGAIGMLLENLKEDAGLRVEFRPQSVPGRLAPDLSKLILDIVMEFAFALVIGRSAAPEAIFLTAGGGWLILDLPALWGNSGRAESALAGLRIHALGGSAERDGDGARMRVRLPIAPQ